ncbi:META domain-containing protein [Streptomyces sp. CC219B]|uniref:META domain-containing protein n=1 Tax=Streptomyces sp. CC219B TaxID=3044574 RepID=UPI0024A93E02|nr:META domain-containing protein [Streptomyces sp. CC219B]
MKRTTRMKYAAVALVGTVVLAACGTESGDGSDSRSAGDGGKAPETPRTLKASDIAGVEWVPLKVTVKGKDHPLPTDEKQFPVDEARITFKPGAAEPDVFGGDSGGTVGCNSFGADAKLDGDTLKITDLAATQMGCLGPVQEFENRFLDVFDGSLKVALKGRDGSRTLTLTSTDGDSITLREQKKDKADAKAVPLKGTKWTIDTLTSGTGDDGSAQSLPEGVEPHLTLAENGTVSGNYGCNTFRGKADVKSGTIEFGRLSSTKMACQGKARKTELALIDFFSGKVSYQHKDRTLTLTNASGEGLVAHAEPEKK